MPETEDQLLNETKPGPQGTSSLAARISATIVTREMLQLILFKINFLEYQSIQGKRKE